MTSPDTTSGQTTASARRVQISTGPETIRVLRAELADGLIPDTYVSGGALVHMETVSGGPPSTAADEDAPLPVAASVVTPATLAGLLAEHAFVYRLKEGKDAQGLPKVHEQEATPSREVLGSVLAKKTWPRVPPLVGVIGAPVLRRDGTLLQQPGYDPATGLYLASRVALPPVPERPTARQVDQARDFLLNRFLRDFPWSSPADRANYIALLVTPILRHFTRSLTPFGIIDATMPASGKTILTAGPGMLYGQKVLTWPDADDGELRKSITAVFAEQVGAVIFDNIAEGSVIDSPVLAQLVTGTVWADRVLGSSRTFAAANDRLWLATGNNLQVGGDMASRTVRVHLDPNMPRPEARDQSGFGIPHLDQWITVPANQLTVLWHLLVLVLDWTSQGAPRAHGVNMRQFTTWACHLGGFLAHHGIGGFLDNAAEVAAIDDGELRWQGFLSAWHERYGSTPVTAADLRSSAEPDHLHGQVVDAWGGRFITNDKGRLPNPYSLGKLLTGQKGRWRGDYVIRAGMSERGDRGAFWVERGGQVATPKPAETSPHLRISAELPF